MPVVRCGKDLWYMSISWSGKKGRSDGWWKWWGCRW